jgi:DNA-binding response OmpR family regulator
MFGRARLFSHVQALPDAINMAEPKRCGFLRNTHKVKGMDGLRVLVVEDEGLIAMVLVDFLEDLGFKVVGPHAKLEPAVAAAKSEHFDVALLDVNLGGNSVYPVADELIARGIPFAFMTGHDARSLPAPYHEIASLSKPYTAIDVEKTLGALLPNGER